MTETTEKPKKSARGGARLGAGAKKMKPETTAMRVDARLVELINVLKISLKNGIVDKYDIEKMARDFEKRNLDYFMDSDDGRDSSGKTSADYAAEYKKRLNAAIDKHGAKLKGGMGLFDLLQKCIKDSATLIRNGVITEGEVIKKFIAAHGLKDVQDIRTFDEWRGNRRV